MQISTNRAIYLSQQDVLRLRDLIRQIRSLTERDTAYLDALAARIDSALVVRPQDMPRDVVTMNTRVRVRDPDSGRDFVYTLVFPLGADVALDRISVLAPLGAALLGAREGEPINWMTPSGERHLEIEAILYQPEASGDYHL